MSHDPSPLDDDLDLTDRVDAVAPPLGAPERARHLAEPAVGPAADWDLDLDPVASAPSDGRASAPPGSAGATEFEQLVRRQLALLGEDPAREGIV
ncbi:MAG TPA: hypothetical protein VFX39_08315, partial [Gemmatimonadaceae bacterium]|nr:hypothetical protein [Gemmatimonadaceae bacterium]